MNGSASPIKQILVIGPLVSMVKPLGLGCHVG